MSDKPKIGTEWTNEVVVLVLRGERNISRCEFGAFGVGEQAFTGGPVLRGPWGMVGGMQSDWTRYEAECKRLNDAFVQGFLRGRRAACDLAGRTTGEWCEARDGENYCHRCGGTVVVDRREIAPKVKR